MGPGDGRPEDGAAGRIGPKTFGHLVQNSESGFDHFELPPSALAARIFGRDFEILGRRVQSGRSRLHQARRPVVVDQFDGRRVGACVIKLVFCVPDIEAIISRSKPGL